MVLIRGGAACGISLAFVIVVELFELVPVPDKLYNGILSGVFAPGSGAFVKLPVELLMGVADAIDGVAGAPRFAEPVW